MSTASQAPGNRRWQQFVMQVGAIDPERIEAVLSRHGALSVTLSDAADNPVLEPAPGETPLWQHTQISGLFDEDADIDGLCGDLLAALDVDELPGWRLDILEDRAWEREWLRDFRPMQFGRRLWICPTDHPRPPGSAVVVRLDPGLAFGTGTHPTTALCLERLDQEFPENVATEKRVLDFGCGSGILAISSVMLGAREAVAVDIDPQAVAATRTNAERNGVAARVCALPADRLPQQAFDVVVANILAAPLENLAAELTDRVRTGGRLILSGILSSQANTVMDAYRDLITFEAPAQRDDWLCLAGQKA